MLNRSPSAMKAFNRAADPDAPPTPSAETLLDAILAERPDLRGLPVEVPERGNVAHTLIIGDEVFKGPRAIITSVNNEKECAALQQLESLNLPIPRVTYVGKDTVFFGMTRLPGVTAAAVDLTDEEQFQLGADVEDVMIDIAKAFPDEKQGRFFTNIDTNMGNVLIDPETRRMTAVIDFGITFYIDREDLYRRGDDPYAAGTQAEFEARKGELPTKPKPPRP